ncbi:tRNA (adenosine(37)-N6)-threonylcarbamoyltransferase complex ATPase subunit type 1 TsaE [Iamia sp. SCSIO 61187]|uniref:hypothetical protein n=1 Tax=Iamia sp. SCSIO 61187 TaxID=2722752 RepID=UPI001C6376CE|nr:hypothetical protein [Iamia sp. SCSIO 61187]QYG91172.1 tRNA (adenosine(37)-N6)-threonylcarbamoyltransferase complex ATPase subunit type 1 TsaE [Iamia sp. SCSIO 61187]
MSDFETALETIRAMADSGAPEADQGRNEAQTRLDLIDRLIFECLGWQRDQVHVEVHLDGQYTDYELGSGGRQVVVEAKREGRGFELPAGMTRPTMKLKDLQTLSADISDAILQVLQYGQTRGIPIAAVSNGHQLVAFLSSRTDGTPPLEGRALVFDSWAAMRDRFKDLWDALSPAGAQTRRLMRMLDADKDAPPPERLSSRILGYPGYKNRNPVAAELQILGGMFFEDIVRQPAIEAEFLRECYMSSGSLSQYALVSKEILSARYSIYSEAEAEASLTPVRSRSGVSKDLVSDVFAASLGKRPIILLGDVGVGKTMFTRHFIKVEASDILSRSFVLYIDFGSKPAVSDDLPSYVAGELQHQLVSEYGQNIDDAGFVKSMYRPELQTFERGIHGQLKESDPEEFRRQQIAYLGRLMENREEHLKRALDHYIKAQRKQAVVFLDNVDQRPFDFQEQVFLIGQALASDWPVTCFLALRPETFSRSKREGALTGYQPRVFTIEPPRVDRVIERRLAFAIRELQDSGRLATYPEGVTVSSSKLESYLQLVLEAFNSNKDIVGFVDNMSGGNVRRALEYVTSFIGSGHVDTEKIFNALRRGGYTLPFHEFFRAVLYGEHEYYDPSDSPIPNVLDISKPDGREHFLQPLVVAFLERAANAGNTQGFVPTPEVYAYGQSLGFETRQIARALDRCAASRLIDTHPRYIHEAVRGADSEQVRVGSAGVYIIRQLLTDFQYLDAVGVDTPIVDSSARARFQTGWGLDERLQRAEALRQYLDEQWLLLNGDDLPFDWAKVSAVAKHSIDDVRTRSARRASGATRHR